MINVHAGRADLAPFVESRDWVRPAKGAGGARELFTASPFGSYSRVRARHAAFLERTVMPTPSRSCANCPCGTLVVVGDPARRAWPLDRFWVTLTANSAIQYLFDFALGWRFIGETKHHGKSGNAFRERRSLAAPRAYLRAGWPGSQR
jgi:hypothetical protein